MYTIQRVALSLLLFTGTHVFSQPYPNPYRMVDTWAKLPDGRTMGAVGDVRVDPDGLHIWPHGLDVDKDGNVWVTDAVSEQRTPEGNRGHQVIKFTPQGEVLMVIGNPGNPGNGEYEFNASSDVAIADNGDIFIADGHGVNLNNRIMKYSSDGTFIKSWGKTGYGPGEFRNLHAMAIDSRGRIFVADRGNNRLQIFDQEGNFIAQWTQFGRPSGVFFDEDDNIYVSDSESDNVAKAAKICQSFSLKRA